MNIGVSKEKLFFNDKGYKCAIGKNGVSSDKKEGDGAIPAGCFNLRQVLYRADKISEPETNLTTQIINKNDLWCDNPTHETYNTMVKLPHSGSYENLWRVDDVYDIVAPIGYNDDPPIAGKGSAIFIHVARESYSPTAGCIALAMPDLLEILRVADRETKICIE